MFQVGSVGTGPLTPMWAPSPHRACGLPPGACTPVPAPAPSRRTEPVDQAGSGPSSSGPQLRVSPNVWAPALLQPPLGLAPNTPASGPLHFLRLAWDAQKHPRHLPLRTQISRLLSKAPFQRGLPEPPRRKLPGAVPVPYSSSLTVNPLELVFLSPSPTASAPRRQTACLPGLIPSTRNRAWHLVGTKHRC